MQSLMVKYPLKKTKLKIGGCVCLLAITADYTIATLQYIYMFFSKIIYHFSSEGYAANIHHRSLHNVSTRDI